MTCNLGSKFEQAMANEKCRGCGTVFRRSAGPAVMEMCPERHSRQIRRATTLVLDRLAAVNPCGFCKHSEKAHRYRTTGFLDACTIPGCGCQDFVSLNVMEDEPPLTALQTTLTHRPNTGSFQFLKPKRRSGTIPLRPTPHRWPSVL
jgi:hypothetical protein